MSLPGRKIARFVQQGRQRQHRDFELPPEEHAEDFDLDDDDEDEDGDADRTDLEVVEEVMKRLDSGDDEDKDEEVEELMVGFDPDDTIPDWAVDEETWERAVTAVDPEGDGADNFEDPWIAVAYVYKELGGTIDESA